jgi:putative flippase GtrA
MRRLAELLRFSVAGAGSFLLDVVALVAFKSLTTMPLALDAALAFAAAAAVNFILIRRWVFATAAAGSRPSADLARYALLVLAGLGLTTLAVPVLTAAPMDYRVAKLVASGLVAALNYLVIPRWIFLGSDRV